MKLCNISLYVFTLYLSLPAPFLSISVPFSPSLYILLPRYSLSLRCFSLWACIPFWHLFLFCFSLPERRLPSTQRLSALILGVNFLKASTLVNKLYIVIFVLLFSTSSYFASLCPGAICFPLCYSFIFFTVLYIFHCPFYDFPFICPAVEIRDESHLSFGFLFQPLSAFLSVNLYYFPLSFLL